MANYGPAYGSLAENQAKVRQYSLLIPSYTFLKKSHPINFS